MPHPIDLLASDDLRRYIEATGENGLVDAKRAMKWDDVEAKASLARDIVAFANSEGGGAIVVGKKELDDGTFEIDELTEDQSASFDTTAVADWINSRFEPAIAFTCHRVLYEGKRVVVIVVSEFSELPTICVKQCQVPDKGNLIQRGEIIVRSENGSSTRLQTRDQLATLISRALLKREDRLREIFDRVITGRTAESKPTDESKFDQQVLEIETSLKPDIDQTSKLGEWRFVIHGERFERKWHSVSELISAIERRQVPRWHGFPSRYLRALPTEWGVASELNYRSLWAMTYEGLVYYVEDYSENHAEYRSRWMPMSGKPRPTLPAGKWMDSVWPIYQICMYFDFASRYAAEFDAAENLRIAIEASGLNGRELLCVDPMVSTADIGDYSPSKAQAYRFSRTLPAGALQAEWKELAADASHSFLQLFPVGLEITRITVEKWVEKYETGSVRW